MEQSDSIRICDLIIYPGRNIYSHRPAVKMIVDIGGYSQTPTKDIEGFNEKLLADFPGLKTNCCGLGYEGGFLERLKEGTYLAHVLEHVVLEMQAMIGYDVRFGKTRMLDSPSRYNLIFEYQNEVGALECSKAAVYILNAYLRGETVETDGMINYLRRVSLEAELGPSTSAIVEEAKKRGIPVTRIGQESFVQLSYGRCSRRIESTLTDSTSCISADISSNKQLTKEILREHQVPVPQGKTVYSEISAVMVAGQIGVPVVVKPLDGNQGKGVHLGLSGQEEIREAFREAAHYSAGVIVERYVTGRDYRILVVGDRVRAVSERRPACVAGDGAHTVRELIEIVNRDPLRGEQHEKPMTKLRLDAVAENVLRKNGMDAESVPAAGQTVLLRENGNLSTGGTAADCTDRIHPENARIAVRAARAVGIDIAGIDMVAQDIAQPVTETGGVVVEVNTAPGIRMHLYPSEGKARNVAGDIVDFLFPDENSRRFPIVSVTGTNGKTTTVRLIEHALSLTGLAVGMTCTSGTFVGGECICPGDHSGPVSARALLSGKQIDAAVLETARGGIIRGGLGYDLADVGVITNISEDHLGLDGVETLEDLVFVKSLVAEAVKSDGAAVLNAEDASTPKILERIHVRPVLFAGDYESVRPFRKTDAVFVYVQDGLIRVEDRGRIRNIAAVADIPVTCGGMLACNVENCLAAAAALYALKLPPSAIADGLKTFTENEGRFSLYEAGGYRVMLDYGHNPEAYRQAIGFLRHQGGGRLIGVIGMPGDRTDASMQAAARLCADGFDRIYIKEDQDLRGRRKGETAGIFCRAVVESGFPPDSVRIIENEKEALCAAMADACVGDLIAVFYEKLEPLQEILKKSGAVQAGAEIRTLTGMH